MNMTPAVLFAVAISAGGHSEKTIVAHYSFDVPSGYRLKIASRCEDFDLYALTRRDDKKTLCTLYLGNAPRFPIRKWEGKPVETTERGRTRRSFRSSNAIEGVITFSGLTYKDTPFTPFG